VLYRSPGTGFCIARLVPPTFSTSCPSVSQSISPSADRDRYRRSTAEKSTIMAPRDVNLCSFCWGLVGPLGDVAELPVEKPHHSTYGALLASSATCSFCKTIVQAYSSFLTPEAGYKEANDLYESWLKVSLPAARNMSSGVSWIFVEVTLGRGDSFCQWILYLTVLSCSTDSKRTFLFSFTCLMCLLRVM
jgi:hypothetical protein